MKLRDKKTGEIWTLINRNEGTSAVVWVSNGSQTQRIESIEELTSRFEDYEEPLKPYWYINDLDGEPMKCDLKNCGKSNFTKWGEYRKKIGNYFETKEEAEKAVEKLKAWNRLKDKGFRFEGLTLSGWGCPCIEYKVDGGISDSSSDMQVREDLALLFGGEE